MIKSENGTVIAMGERNRASSRYGEHCYGLCQKLH